MPRDEAAYSEDERRPRTKGKQAAASGSDDSDSEDAKPSKQIARREVTLKEVAKRGKSKAKPKKRRDDSDSEEEVIVTRTVRKKTLDFDDLDPGYVKLLCAAFKVAEGKVETWCKKERIKWDNKDNEYSIDKIKADEEDDDCRYCDKEYKKQKKMWQRPSEKEAGGGSSRGLPMIIDNRPVNVMAGYGFDPRCDICYDFGSFCGDPGHGRYY